MSISPDIFKAYDVRGLYPQEIDAAKAALEKTSAKSLRTRSR